MAISTATILTVGKTAIECYKKYRMWKIARRLQQAEQKCIDLNEKLRCMASGGCHE